MKSFVFVVVVVVGTEDEEDEEDVVVEKVCTTISSIEFEFRVKGTVPSSFVSSSSSSFSLRDESCGSLTIAIVPLVLQAPRMTVGADDDDDVEHMRPIFNGRSLGTC